MKKIYKAMGIGAAALLIGLLSGCGGGSGGAQAKAVLQQAP